MDFLTVLTVAVPKFGFKPLAVTFNTCCLLNTQFYVEHYLLAFDYSTIELLYSTCDVILT